MRRAILILTIFILVIGARTGALSAMVVLRESTEVTSAQVVRLGDVATITASDSLKAKLADISLGVGPIPGTERGIDASYIRLRIKATAGESVVVEGPRAIKLVGKCVRIGAEELISQAQDLVTGKLPQGGCTYELIVQRPPRELTLPDNGDLEIRPRLAAAAAKPGLNTVIIDAMSGGRILATTSVTVQVNAVADVLVATSVISQGEPITLQNATWEQRDVTRISNAVVLPAGGELQDFVAKRTLSAGGVITTSDVALPPAIRKGETVSLSVRCGNVVLRTTAEAKQDGRVGDFIRVRPPISNQDLRARIAEPGLVEIVR